MIDWVISVNQLLRTLREEALFALDAIEKRDFQELESIKQEMKRIHEKLQDKSNSYYKSRFKAGPLEENLEYLKKHLYYSEQGDYRAILLKDIPLIEKKLDDILVNHQRTVTSKIELSHAGELLISSLHPEIIKHSFSQFGTEHYQDAMLNAVKALMQMIREKVKPVDLDGDKLITDVFGIKNNPKLIFDNIDTETGKNIQTGFMMILQGIVKGIRNPTAHGFEDITKSEAIQFLMFASFLATKIENTTKVS